MSAHRSFPEATLTVGVLPSASNAPEELQKPPKRLREMACRWRKGRASRRARRSSRSSRPTACRPECASAPFLPPLVLSEAKTRKETCEDSSMTIVAERNL